MKKPVLLFLIDEGIGGIELTSIYKDDYVSLTSALTNIVIALEPLKEKYEPSVLLYPTWHYQQHHDNPLKRISPQLHYTLNFFRDHYIPVYFELYSSGIRTNQNGELGSLEEAPLFYNDKIKRKSLSMDLDTLIALKQAYPDTLIGVRFHELIGSNDIGLADYQNGNEDKSHAWRVEMDVIRAIVDVCKSHQIRLVWGDHSFNLVLGYDPSSFINPPYRYWQEVIDYAADNLGELLTLNWANNGWPMAQYITDSFAYMNYKNTKWGVSVQSWFWSESDVSTLRSRKYYPLADNDMPVELMTCFSLGYLALGASLIQYEPPYYFFNYYQTGTLYHHLKSHLSLVNLRHHYEDLPDYSERLRFKRFKEIMLNPELNISNNIQDFYTTDHIQFKLNRERIKPKKYLETSLFHYDISYEVFDRYNSNPKIWYQSTNRLLNKIFQDTVKIVRINADFSATDELLVWKRKDCKDYLEIYNHYSGLMYQDDSMLIDSANVIDMTTANLISSMANHGDPDEIIIARKHDKKFLLDIYQGYDTENGLMFKKVNHPHLPREFSLENYCGIVGLRTRQAVYLDGTRPLDGLAIIYKKDNVLTIDCYYDYENYKYDVMFKENIVAICAGDIDLDYQDELCVLLNDRIRFIKINETNPVILTDEIKLNQRRKGIFAMRFGTYFNAD